MICSNFQLQTETFECQGWSYHNNLRVSVIAEPHASAPCLYDLGIRRRCMRISYGYARPPCLGVLSPDRTPSDDTPLPAVSRRYNDPPTAVFTTLMTPYQIHNPWGNSNLRICLSLIYPQLTYTVHRTPKSNLPSSTSNSPVRPPS